MKKWWYREDIEETNPHQPGVLEWFTLDEIISTLEHVNQIREASPFQMQALEYLKQYRDLLALIEKQHEEITPWLEGGINERPQDHSRAGAGSGGKAPGRMRGNGVDIAELGQPYCQQPCEKLDTWR